MIVRAAKAKLSAKDQKISLQGMNEKGPVRVILNQGEYVANVLLLKKTKKNRFVVFLSLTKKVIFSLSYYSHFLPEDYHFVWN